MFKLLPFIRCTANLVTGLHQERLERCIIFPVPSFAAGIWRAVKPFLDKGTAEKIFIVSGPAGVDDALPEKVTELMTEELINKIEKTRGECQV